jgi:hypothetical protein
MHQAMAEDVVMMIFHFTETTLSQYYSLVENISAQRL